MNDAMTRGLRDLADWMDDHPEIARPPGIALNVFPSESPREIARILHKAEKDPYGDWFALTRKFGPVSLSFCWPRKGVCTSRVVGTEEVPERVIARYTRDIVEWECPKIMEEVV